MDQRKKEILEATIEQFIETSAPVGSKSLALKPGFQMSPATIRNELNELEKEGYLNHLHTSSGRIPTDKGYRFYVDSLIEPPAQTAIEIYKIKKQVATLSCNIRELLDKIGEILTEVIQYTTIVLTPDIYHDTLKVVHLILVDIDKILVVLLSTMGENQEFLFNIQENLSQEDLNKISSWLTEKLKGKSLLSLTEDPLSEIVQTLPYAQHILNQLLLEARRLSQFQRRKRRLLTTGISHMLKLPEFQNIELTKRVLTFLEEDRLLVTLLQDSLKKNTDAVKIGAEIENENLTDCSIVVSSVSLDNHPVGAIGVLGPKRMSYAQVIPLVQGISRMIEAYLNNMEIKS